MPGRGSRSAKACPPPAAFADRALSAVRRPWTAFEAVPSLPGRLLRGPRSPRGDPSLRPGGPAAASCACSVSLRRWPEARERITAPRPVHGKQSMAQLAQGPARLWTQLAHELDAGNDPAVMSS
ncbi:hypothetical protein GCM10010358_38240 [Streptomyces minutiscleroticus]|uniref:Uncharacterized protein n=1 Tax=Streptomyces minutiscleroticus TaxID=68238 RepID=A0A918NM31_9ACTN|nr:hypothetical protein GCM10010358_38240 [Streptomyces minutiscleroticus]